MIVSLKPCASVRLIVCALWQSLQTGSCLVVAVTFGECTLFSNLSWIPTWQAPHVPGMLSRLTLDLALSAGRTLCAVWQLVHTALTTSPLCESPVPWMLSAYRSTISVCLPV